MKFSKRNAYCYLEIDNSEVDEIFQFIVERLEIWHLNCHRVTFQFLDKDVRIYWHVYRPNAIHHLQLTDWRITNGELYKKLYKYLSVNAKRLNGNFEKDNDIRVGDRTCLGYRYFVFAKVYSKITKVV